VLYVTSSEAEERVCGCSSLNLRYFILSSAFLSTVASSRLASFTRNAMQ
jgi:hypothetical protein